MTTSLFAAHTLFAPLQRLACAIARRRGSPSPGRAALAPQPPAQRPVGAVPAPGALRPLRVVRVLEGPAAGTGGRIVISGRMADVCAELERLAALEAAAG